VLRNMAHRDAPPAGRDSRWACYGEPPTQSQLENTTARPFR